MTLNEALKQCKRNQLIRRKSWAAFEAIDKQGQPWVGGGVLGYVYELGRNPLSLTLSDFKARNWQVIDKKEE